MGENSGLTVAPGHTAFVIVVLQTEHNLSSYWQHHSRICTLYKILVSECTNIKQAHGKFSPASVGYNIPVSNVYYLYLQISVECMYNVCGKILSRNNFLHHIFSLPKILKCIKPHTCIYSLTLLSQSRQDPKKTLIYLRILLQIKRYRYMYIKTVAVPAHFDLSIVFKITMLR